MYVFDPYSVALQVARLRDGLEDVALLLRRRLITVKSLETMLLSALPRALEFDIDLANFANTGRRCGSWLDMQECRTQGERADEFLTPSKRSIGATIAPTWVLRRE
jgi:hypothetical protein